MAVVGVENKSSVGVPVKWVFFRIRNYASAINRAELNYEKLKGWYSNGWICPKIKWEIIKILELKHACIFSLAFNISEVQDK